MSRGNEGQAPHFIAMSRRGTAVFQIADWRLQIDPVRVPGIQDSRGLVEAAALSGRGRRGHPTRRAL